MVARLDTPGGLCTDHHITFLTGHHIPRIQTHTQVLPFLEYDLHRQLMLKLRVQGRNAVFALRSQLQVRSCVGGWGDGGGGGGG